MESTASKMLKVSFPLKEYGKDMQASILCETYISWGTKRNPRFIYI